MTTLNEGNFHEGLQYLALCRQRGCVLPVESGKDTMNDAQSL